MASLREVQESFAASLRDSAATCAVRPHANLDIYRNNLRIAWRQTLERAYPVVRRRVGEQFFRQLCVRFQEQVPSISGDLHDYDSGFATFLDEYLEPDYAWLADLARLERSHTECSVAVESAAIGAGALARYSPQQLEQLVFGFQPSLKLHSFPHPVFSVWSANQEENASPVDQSLGQEQGMVRIRADLVEVHIVEPVLFSFVSALAGGSALVDAVTTAGISGKAITDALAFLFREGLVCSLTVNEGTERCR